MKKALITGVTGQDGAYLAKVLLNKGYKIYGGCRQISKASLTRLEWLGVAGDVELIDFDLSDVDQVNRSISAIQPDELYNLAAQSSVGLSWSQPTKTTFVNAVGVLNVLEAIRAISPHIRFYQASTSEVFGKVEALAQREEMPFHPRSPYGVSKVFGHFITMNYRESFGLHASSGILFNHESPLRGQEFVTRKITSGLAQMAKGQSEPLVLGNLDARRDWGFAGDYVEGMWRMVQQETADDFILATGIATSVREFVELAAQVIELNIEWVGEGLEERGIDRKSGRTIVEVSDQLYRPADVQLLVGDSSRAKNRLGWQAKVSIGQLAIMMMEADLTGAAPKLPYTG